MPTTKTAKPAAAKAPRKTKTTVAKKKEPVVHHAAKEHKEPKEHVEVKPAEVATEVMVTTIKPEIKEGRYVFATGRRKTAIANVRLFMGDGKSQVNKKPFEQYFSYGYHQEDALKPLSLTGLNKDYYFVAHINGGGPNSQVGALRHGIATALGTLSEDIRKILKKNGMLTRDDRKKERKKPGLKRARRSPQWAKR
jgi:small subunit ribosomal protein S9